MSQQTSTPLVRACRVLWNQPGFSAVIIATFALGIGATTAIFSLMYQVMLQPLPVERPHELWRIGGAAKCCQSVGYAQNDWNFFSWEAYEHLRKGATAFEDLAAFQVGSAALGLRRAGAVGAVEHANGQYVSGNFFRTFGVQASLGRLLTDDDDRLGAAPAAVMSFHAWTAKFSADPTVVGAVYQINGRPFTIVGIGAPTFFGAKVSESGMPDVWLPLAAEPAIEGPTSRLRNPRSAWLNLIGRSRSGTRDALEAQTQTVFAAWLASHAADMNSNEHAATDRQTVRVTAGGGGVSLMRETYANGLRLLALAALCVLLVAGANIANLLVSRGLRQRDQNALHIALGASRWQMVGRTLAETLVLAVCGGVGGVIVAYGGERLIMRLAFRPDTWVSVTATPSTPVLAFASIATVLTGVVFGLSPAMIASRADPIDALRGGGRSAAPRRHWVQKTLVIVQAAVSLVLLNTAGLLGQSFNNLGRQHFGFEADGRYLVPINAKLSSHPTDALPVVLTDLQESLRGIPGVRGASLALYAPLSRYDWHHDIMIAGRPEPGPKDDMSSGWTRVTPGFFETLGNRIVLGRAITDQDSATARPVAVINQAFAKQFFGKEDPIGKLFGPASQRPGGVFEIVGVAADMRYFTDTTKPSDPMYFVPQAQTVHFEEAGLQTREISSHFPNSIVLWADDRVALEAHVAKALSDAGVPGYRAQPYADVIEATFSQQNMLATLARLFGIVGLVLATVGVYGVTSYGVQQQTHEIGVRIAIGADRRRVLGMVVGAVFRQLGIGVVIGVPTAVAGGYWMHSQLFGVRSVEPVMLFDALLVLAAAAMAAAIVPAYRASRVDPIAALRLR
jgi:putative ABC transport system permease protein